MNLTAHLSKLGQELLNARHQLAQVQDDLDNTLSYDDDFGLADGFRTEIDALEEKIGDIENEIADCEEELDELSNQHSSTDEQDW
jgi:chromosome segregation ATPase